jgi:NhaA family Na+:H+ antiporter
MNGHPMDHLFKPFRRFILLESFSGILLIASMAGAVALANSPWSHGYFRLLEQKIGIQAGAFVVSKSVLHWVNDGLMTIFFFVVGLEIKREMVAGELASPRKAALPIVAALGGMAVPALIFTAINLGHSSLKGWGIPMATDIAFALGILTLIGSKAPVSLKIFLSALAIIDDLGSVLVIAVFYTSHISVTGLVYALLIFAALILIGRLGVRSPWAYLLLGIPLWFFLLHSGVHGTIAGVLVAWTIPSISPLSETGFASLTRRIVDRFAAASYKEETPILNQERLDAIEELEEACRKVEPPLQRLERHLHPWTSYLILPLFALANAGVRIDANLLRSFSQPVSYGILCGLVLGKPLGIFLASWVAVRLDIGALPDQCSFRQILGAGMLGGIGFTMSIFIAGLAFGQNEMLATSKLSIFAASFLSGLLGWLFLKFNSK